MKSQDHYRILGLVPSASGDDIKRAYRLLAHRFHPDVSADPNGECKFKAVAEAYRTLKGDESRRAYDRLALPTVVSREFVGTCLPFDFWPPFFSCLPWAWFWLR